MILVTGATGHFGRAAIDSLLKKGISSSQISALVRDPAKAENLISKGITIKTGDYGDYSSLVNAFKGTEKLLLVSSSDLNDRTTQHINAIRAAKESGVKHIVYTSFQRKHDTGSPIQFIADSHIAAENEIKASGLTYTILQNGLYADFIPWFIGENVFENGIFQPAGRGKAAFTLRSDMAEAAANILVEDGHENRVYQNATNETNSYADIAQILSDISGKQVTYTDAAPDQFIAVMTKAGVPADAIGMLSGFGEAIKRGEFDFDNNDLERLLHRKPVTITEFLKSVYQFS